MQLVFLRLPVNVNRFQDPAAGHIMASVIVNCPFCLAAFSRETPMPVEQSPVISPSPNHFPLRTALKALRCTTLVTALWHVDESVIAALEAIHSLTSGKRER